MGSHLIIEGNAVYEVDDACMQALERKKKEQQMNRKKQSGKKGDKRKIPH